MTLELLCEKIGLVPEAREFVLKYADTDEAKSCMPFLAALTSMQTEAQARSEIAKRIKPDEKHFKQLCIQLICAVSRYEWYKEKNICDEIYYDSMRYFSRCVKECYEIDGFYNFDRGWWTTRYLSGVLFRIGTLDFELKDSNGQKIVFLHIASDSDLSEKSVRSSVSDARLFFKEHFPEFACAPFWCDSWMLAPEMAQLLPEHSKIVQFGKLFSYQKTEYGSDDYLYWIFKTRSKELPKLCEVTTLQKNLKAWLIAGNKIGVGYGVYQD